MLLAQARRTLEQISVVKVPLLKVKHLEKVHVQNESPPFLPNQPLTYLSL